MRIVLTSLTIAFFYALTATIISQTVRTVSDFIYSFVMTFSFILLPLFLGICVFHFLLNIYRWTKNQPTILIQVLILWLVFDLTLLLIHLPDFFRHQNTPGYLPYKSFTEYFITNILEGFVTATIFAIAIPLLDKFFKDKIFKHEKFQKHERK